MQTVSIFGIGRVGGALALALPRNKYEIKNLVGRSLENARKISSEIDSGPNVLDENELAGLGEDIILITTGDSEISAVSKKLAELGPGRETVVLHTSGSLSSEVLRNQGNSDYHVGSLHPLVSISDSRLGPERMRDAYFAVEGDDSAVRIGNEIARDLGGKPFTVETKNKALYHASAVTACGHLVALLDTAFRMFSKCGGDEIQSKEILMPLIKSTISNLEDQNSADALTGTFARVDTETFQRHIEAMKGELSAEDRIVYLRLGLQSLGLVGEDPDNKGRISDMKEKILLEEKKLRKKVNRR
ncbi:MAG: DUF2520 domain-containing protein [Pyrinomonadaceae bacterium]|nr:DUF2520 domain-containing protein [Pyrinomonadaceae bacterium]